MKTALLLPCFTLYAAFMAPAQAQQPITGAVFTTNETCEAVNENIYEKRDLVFINGGPQHGNSASLPDGWYYVQVTDPSGNEILGVSTGFPMVQVVGGQFAQCYKLWDLVYKSSDFSQGYDLTANPGKEYKVWISNLPDFPPHFTKTDNFKVLKPDVEPIPV
ncbi:MAG: hypothetical protein KGN80_09890 [Acidobacteriota bacterium]|nr:hypothetical protein [Acidobacteriota bacterium]